MFHKVISNCLRTYQNCMRVCQVVSSGLFVPGIYSKGYMTSNKLVVMF